MKISFNWLREFIDVPHTAREVGRRLTDVGLTLDAVLDVAGEDGDDTVLDLDIQSNRGDCLSHLGVAREIAAIYGWPIRLPAAEVPDPATTDEAVAVSIEDSALCGRYTARVIEGVRVGPSPEWIVRRLQACAIRPVNNIADITNYVLLELGHPLHAFDLDRLASREIAVRNARHGETLETLDGVRRTLDPTMLAITDGRQPVALAGIMGGRASEISDETRNVLIESAWFDPVSIRRTARALNLNTDASYRFERGADRDMAALASDRAARLILDLAGGTVSSRLVDAFPGRTEPDTVMLRRERIARHLGAAIPDQDVVAILGGLSFRVEAGPEGWKLGVPAYRHDISREEDILEELARHYGYDRFPSTLPVWSGAGKGLPWQDTERATRAALRGLGYSETCTLAFSDEETEKRFAPDDEPVALRNPLSGDEPVLRTSLVPSMLRALVWNLNRGIRDLKLYEIGKVYPRKGEYRQLVLAMTGAVWPRNVHNRGLEAGFFGLKGDVETLLAGFGNGRPDANLPGYYHPGRSVRLGDRAVLGELRENVAQEFRIRQKVYLAEIQVERLYETGLRIVAVTPIPKYPRVRRDFSLLLDRAIRFSEVASAVRSAGVPELVSVLPFDRLERGSFPESCYSLAIGIEYQPPDRTLTDAEVEEYDRRVLARLEAIGARLRSGS